MTKGDIRELVMDILVCVVIVASAALGAHKGFALTIISFMQWFVCLILGIILCGPVRTLIYDHTTMDDFFQEAIATRLSASVTDSPTYNSIPDLFSGWVQDGTNSLIATTAAEITSVILTVISFVLIILGIRLVCYIIVHGFSKKHHKGFIGFADGLGGFAVGLVRGIIYVFIGISTANPINT